MGSIRRSTRIYLLWFVAISLIFGLLGCGDRYRTKQIVDKRNDGISYYLLIKDCNAEESPSNETCSTYELTVNKLTYQVSEVGSSYPPP